MTVAYETGAASSPADLLSKLITFATANGWTVNTPASGKVFINGTILCGVQTDTNTFRLRGGVTYAAGSAWNAQTGASASSAEPFMNLLTAGPFPTYHFYVGNEGTANYINIVVEISAGVFRHASLCQLVKFGNYTGGECFDASFQTQLSGAINDPLSTSSNFMYDQRVSIGSQRGHIRTNADARANTFSDFLNDLTATAAAGDIRAGMTDQLFLVGTCRWNLRTVLEPIRVYVNRPSSLRSCAGRVPNMRLCRMDFFGAGDEFEIGGATWKVFPVFARQSAVVGSTVPSSGLYGYAYLMP